MRIQVHDPTGCGFGLAIGLAQLGQQVAYRGPAEWFAAEVREASRLVGELARHYFGPAASVAQPLPDGAAADLVVVVDVFADLLHSIHAAARAAGADGMVVANDDAGLVYPDRLAQWCEVAAAAPRLAVVDASDRSAPREVGFEQLPHATLLARECAPGDAGPWQPFPFLFQNLGLWLQHHPRETWWIPPSRRRRIADWGFFGTVDHPRYGGRRRAALLAIAARWPGRRGLVTTGRSFADVVAQLQSVGCGLDLPGIGDLCFRLHECLLLGVPVWRPEPRRVVWAPGLDAVIGAAPEPLLDLDPEFVQAVGEQHYSPRAAAAALLAATRRAPRQPVAAG